MHAPCAKGLEGRAEQVHEARGIEHGKAVGAHLRIELRGLRQRWIQRREDGNLTKSR
jgi:hypothetical protein